MQTDWLWVLKQQFVGHLNDWNNWMERKAKLNIRAHPNDWTMIKHFNSISIHLYDVGYTSITQVVLLTSFDSYIRMLIIGQTLEIMFPDPLICVVIWNVSNSGMSNEWLFVIFQIWSQMKRIHQKWCMVDLG